MKHVIDYPVTLRERFWPTVQPTFGQETLCLHRWIESVIGTPHQKQLRAHKSMQAISLYAPLSGSTQSHWWPFSSPGQIFVCNSVVPESIGYHNRPVLFRFWALIDVEVRQPQPGTRTATPHFFSDHFSLCSTAPDNENPHKGQIKCIVSGLLNEKERSHFCFLKWKIFL